MWDTKANKREGAQSKIVVTHFFREWAGCGGASSTWGCSIPLCCSQQANTPVLSLVARRGAGDCTGSCQCVQQPVGRKKTRQAPGERLARRADLLK